MTDVVPVDLVAAAIIACAAAGPQESGTRVVHVASGVRNPLRYGHLVELVQSWFTEHPLYDSDGQPIVVPDWSFPGRGRVQRQLAHAKLALGIAERLLGALPVRGERADLAAPSRNAARLPRGRSDMWSSMAPTPRPRLSSGSTGCSSSGTG